MSVNILVDKNSKDVKFKICKSPESINTCKIKHNGLSWLSRYNAQLIACKRKGRKFESSGAMDIISLFFFVQVKPFNFVRSVSFV